MLSTHIHRESPFFLLYNRDPVLPVHKLIKPTLPYRGNNDIGYRIEQSQIALTTAAKNLEKKEHYKRNPMNIGLLSKSSKWEI